MAVPDAVMTTSALTHVLYKVDITNGAISLSTPISGTVTGTGDPTITTGCSADTVSAGTLSFNSTMHQNRAARQRGRLAEEAQASVGSRGPAQPREDLPLNMIEHDRP